MRAIFVMIKCEMGQAYRVAREMADGIPELSEMHSISGQYDLLGKFYLEADRDIGLFVVETVSVIIQVFWFKRTGRRVFRMAPIHHHFEMIGWSETKVMLRFWIIAAVCGGIGFALYQQSI